MRLLYSGVRGHEGWDAGIATVRTTGLALSLPYWPASAVRVPWCNG